jgi:hypothetical protein
MKKTKLKPYAFLIRPDQVDALQALKEHVGVGHGESIRRALDQYLRQHGEMKPARIQKKKTRG